VWQRAGAREVQSSCVVAAHLGCLGDRLGVVVVIVVVVIIVVVKVKVVVVVVAVVVVVLAVVVVVVVVVSVASNCSRSPSWQRC